MKTCLDCKHAKPVNEFWLNGINSRGEPVRYSACIPCAQIRRGKPPTTKRQGQRGPGKHRLGERIHDFLSIECGWWNAAALADRLGASETHTERWLGALLADGRIRRRMPVGRRTDGAGFEYQADPFWLSDGFVSGPLVEVST